MLLAGQHIATEARLAVAPACPDGSARTGPEILPGPAPSAAFVCYSQSLPSKFPVSENHKLFLFIRVFTPEHQQRLPQVFKTERICQG